MAMFNSYVSLPEGRVYTVYAYMEYMHVQSQTIEINLNIYIYIYLFILFTQYIFKHIYILFHLMGYHGDMMVFFNMTDSYCQYHMRQYEWLGVGVDSME